MFIAAALGSLGGAYLAHIYMWSGISQFALDFSIIPIAATVIGGGGTLVGPVLGCFILVPISELLRAFGTLRIVFYALILMMFIMFRSEGIMVYAQRKYHQFEEMGEGMKDQLAVLNGQCSMSNEGRMIKQTLRAILVRYEEIN